MIIGSSLPGIVSREHPGFRFQSDPNKPTDAAGQDRYNRAAIQVAFLAGVFYTLVGVLRLGFFTNFLSHSVISGFMTGAATLIGLTQMKFFFGYDSIKNKNWSPDSPKSVSAAKRKKLFFSISLVEKKLLPGPRPQPHSSLLSFSLPLFLSSNPNPQVPQYTPFPRGQADDRVVSQLRNLFSKEWLAVFKWRDFVMASAWLVLLLIMKEAGKRSRRLVFLKALGPLTVTGLSIAVTAGQHQGCPSNTKEFNPKCVRVVGKVPKGLPHETVSWWFPMPHAGAKIGLALLVCAIDVLESVSIAKALAYKNGYELAATQELTGLGLANIVGAAFQCYTTTGSFSRSAIMDSVGARTQVAGWVGGLLVMLVLLLLTPIFRNMPQNAQGAIIVSALIGLLQTKEWRFLWRVNKFDWLVFNAAMLGVWFAGVEIGLSISIGLSVALALYNAAFPHTAVLGRLPGTTVYRNVRQYASAKQIDGMLLVRVDAPLFFANVGPVADALRLYEKQYNEAVASAAAAEAAAASPSPPSKEGGNAAAPPPNPPPSPALPDGPRSPLRAIVLDLSPVSDMDASAVHFLSSLVARTRVRGVELALANPSCQVARQMARAKLDSLVGRDRVYVRVGDAVDDLRNALPLVAGGGAAADDTAKEEEEEEKEKEKEEKKKASGDEKV